MTGNPFNHQQPVFEADEFLDRRKEVKELLKLVTSRRNLLVYGLRRRGKTSLIRRVLDQLPKGTTAIYVDAYRALDEADLGLQLLRALAGTGLGRGARFVKWSQEFVQDLGLTIELGAAGTVAFQFDYKRRKHETPFLDALEFLGRIAHASKHHIVVCLDEFQVVAKRLGEDGLWAMRGVVQFQSHVRYIISGSQPSLLRDIVKGQKKGFWTQLTEYPLPGLSVLDLEADIERLFGSALPDACKTYLLDVLGDNTQRLIQVLRHAYDAQAGLDLSAMREAVRAAVEENTPEYERDLDGLRTALQRQLVFVLARHPTKSPTSSKWLKECGIAATPSGVHQTLQVLRNDILDDENHFIDALFMQYLKEP